MKLGAHISIAGGFDKVAARGQAATCEAIQVFVKNNNQWAGRELTDAECEAFRADLEPHGLGGVVAHNTYLVNLCAINPETLEKSIALTIDELTRCEKLGIEWLVLHPGSHMGEGEEAGLAKIAESLAHCFRETKRLKTGIALETTAGQGTNLGWRFEQLATILKKLRRKTRVGVCLDTCHVFAAGYDIRQAKDWKKTAKAFDEIIGLDQLKALHLNDSKTELGSRKDRHAHIGKGHIGLEGFRAIVNDKRLKDLPGLIETPKDNDPQDDIDNLDRLRGLRI